MPRPTNEELYMDFDEMGPNNDTGYAEISELVQKELGLTDKQVIEFMSGFDFRKPYIRINGEVYRIAESTRYNTSTFHLVKSLGAKK